MIMKKFILAALLVFLSAAFGAVCIAQSADEVYKKPLKEVLENIEKVFNVNLEWSDSDVKNVEVHYATWRYTTDVKSTLENILGSAGFVFNEKGNNTYVVSPFEYHIRPVEAGKRHLDQLLSLYSDASAFDKRKADLRQCIIRTLGLNTTAARPPLNPIVRGRKVMDGYTVENVAIETLPGFFLNGNLYRPNKKSGSFPVILSPHGHFYGENSSTSGDGAGRFNENVQYRCAALARMGAIVFSYEMYSWGESIAQTGGRDFHWDPFALRMQTWNSMRALDFLLGLKGADKSRVGITGASGGGTQTFLMTALDDRITASAPVVMVSSSFYGGCACESGLPIHDFCNGYRTNNAEIAAMAAPRPQLVVSDGTDWTASVPGTDYPYLKKVYGLYGKESSVTNVHLPNDEHDYGYSKRVPVYRFFAEALGLNLKAITGKDGNIEEKNIAIQHADALKVFDQNNPMPSTALKGQEAIKQAFKAFHSQSLSLVR